MVNLKNLVRASLMATVAAGAFGGAAVAQLNQTLEVARGNTANGAQTQAQIDRLDDQRTDIELEFRALLEQIESQRLFVEQQRVFLRSQENEIASLQESLTIALEDLAAAGSDSELLLKQVNLTLI